MMAFAGGSPSSFPHPWTLPFHRHQSNRWFFRRSQSPSQTARGRVGSALHPLRRRSGKGPRLRREFGPLVGLRVDCDHLADPGPGGSPRSEISLLSTDVTGRLFLREMVRVASKLSSRTRALTCGRVRSARFETHALLHRYRVQSAVVSQRWVAGTGGD